MSVVIIDSTENGVILDTTDTILCILDTQGSTAAAPTLTTEALTATGDPKVFTSSATPTAGSKTMALDGSATMTEGNGYSRSGATWTFVNTPTNTPVGVYTA